MKAHPSARRGFTIVELMVSLAITAMIVVVLVSVTSVAVDAWRHSRNEVRATRQAKAAIEAISRDFEGLVIRSGNDFQWLGITAESGQLPGPDNSPSSNAAKMVFFTAATDRYDGSPEEDEAGDVSAVIYQLDYQDPIRDGGRFESFALYRRLVNPDETFEKLLAQTDLESVALVSEDVNRENFVCENIYQFTLTFVIETTDDTGALVTERVVIQSDGGVDSLEIFGNKLVTSPENQELTNGRLRGVEISLTVITDSALQTLKVANFQEEQRADFLAQNSYQFSKTIEIPQP